MNEAELLFTEVLNCDRASLYLNRNMRLDKDKAALAASVLEERIAGRPIQYILGKAEFMGLNFAVLEDVLIPRPETEIVVETVKRYVQSQEFRVHNCSILDVGTGSGCIAVSLAKFLPGAKITATDISGKALEVAKRNAALNNVEVNFIQSDLFSACGWRHPACDFIVSNPPYIPSSEIDNLQPEIQYEPRIALDGGRDGLDFYRKITAESPEYLKKNGFLILEMGFSQLEAICGIVAKSGAFKITEVIKDYGNIDRVIVAELTGR